MGLGHGCTCTHVHPVECIAARHDASLNLTVLLNAECQCSCHYPQMAAIPSGQKRQSGASNGKAKLSESDVREIRADTTQTQVALAFKYHVSPSAIARIQRGESWRHVSDERETA